MKGSKSIFKSKIEEKEKLLLHCCCAPCTGYVLECLMREFEVTLLFYNPNIRPDEEYRKRREALDILLAKTNMASTVEVLDYECDYDYEAFSKVALPLQNEPEGGKRCSMCYEFRLRETAVRAVKEKFDIFATTLSVSPHKNASKLNEIGIKLSGELNVKYLEADFKKNDGHKRSIELAKKHAIYIQNYCGCEYSLQSKSGG